MSLFEKIRYAYYGKPIVHDPGIKKTVENLPVAESKTEPPALQSKALQPDTQKQSIPEAAQQHKNKQLPVKGESVVKSDQSFMENLDAVEEEFFGVKRPAGVDLKRDSSGNVCTNDLNFEQKLSVALAEFLGEGPGNTVLIKDNVTSDNASFEENLAAVTNAFTGIGSEKVEVVSDNVTDEKKSFAENFNKIMETFGNDPSLQPSNVPSKTAVKKPVFPKRIKGIHY